MVGITIAFYIILVLIGFVLESLFHIPHSIPALISQGDQPVLFGGGIILLTIMLIIIINILHLYTRWAQKLTKYFAKAIAPIAMHNIIILSIFSSIGEELFFRGVLQNMIGLIASAVIFGALHFNGFKYIGWTISAFVMGLLFGLVVIYTNSIIYPIFMHFIINYFGFIRINRTYYKLNNLSY